MHVWHALPNRPAFSQILEFLDSDPRIKLAKSTKDILANKQAGKVSMVVGWQDSLVIEEENGNERRFANPPQIRLRVSFMRSGFARPISPTNSPTSLAAAC